MIEDLSVLAVIPARAGSKGLAQKNLLNLNGHPLVAWSIMAGLESKYIDSVLVSTDSCEIQEIAQEYGAEAPFLRPSKLAQDNSSSYKVVEHAIHFLRENQGREYDYIALLEPTSPLRTAEDIDEAILLLHQNKEATSVVGIGKCENQHPDFLVSKNNAGFISNYGKKKLAHRRRQELSKVYFLEGSIYLSRSESLEKEKSFYQKKTIGLEFPKWKNYEIDDIIDFMIIERLFDAKKDLE